MYGCRLCSVWLKQYQAIRTQSTHQISSPDAFGKPLGFLLGSLKHLETSWNSFNIRGTTKSTLAASSLFLARCQVHHKCVWWLYVNFMWFLGPSDSLIYWWFIGSYGCFGRSHQLCIHRLCQRSCPVGSALVQGFSILIDWMGWDTSTPRHLDNDIINLLLFGCEILSMSLEPNSSSLHLVTLQIRKA